MPIFTRKQTSVEARQHFGSDLNISSFKAGDQVAHDGDFLVVDAESVTNLRAQEQAQSIPAGSLGNKGVIYVIPKAQFLKDFNAQDQTVVPTLEGDQEFQFTTLAAPVATPVAAPAVTAKS